MNIILRQSFCHFFVTKYAEHSIKGNPISISKHSVIPTVVITKVSKETNANCKGKSVTSCLADKTRLHLAPEKSTEKTT